MFSISLNDIVRFPKLPTADSVEQWKVRISEQAVLLIIRLTLWFRAQISKVRPGTAIKRNVSPAETQDEFSNLYDLALHAGLQPAVVRCRQNRPDNWWSLSPSVQPFVVLMTFRI
ncbi:hypothetical protein SDC9_120786 [bioreactor metagenome]|uniref:Uncharacterized protein n=1 Tax=bioreactor metagenome TaxID=1076179 RepID=A0A645CA42_9ZZZZ